MNKLTELKDQLERLEGTINDRRGSVMGIEGSGSRIYFECISSLLPERYQFNGRSRNPARDEFNALLNYAYGILYSKVEKACIIAGIDPYVGIVHTDHYNKKSMVFDLIENFRIWADETIINLFAARKVKQEHLDKLKNGFTLNKEGKALLVEAFSRFLDESIRYGGRNIKREDIIQFECHKIANGLIKEADLGQ
jgi:CRISPR-associated protein Cas1